MSHVEAYTDIRFVDLDVLAVAAAEIGCELVRGKRTYEWYGRYLRDSLHLPHAAEHAGIVPNGKCEHVVRVAGPNDTTYEVGLVPHPDGKGGWIPLFDSWGASGARLTRQIGKACEKLAAAYAQQATLKVAQENNLKVYCTETEDEITYTLTEPYAGY